MEGCTERERGCRGGEEEEEGKRGGTSWVEFSQSEGQGEGIQYSTTSLFVFLLKTYQASPVSLYDESTALFVNFFAVEIDKFESESRS